MKHNPNNSKLVGVVFFLFLMVVGIYVGGGKGKSVFPDDVKLKSLLATATQSFGFDERLKQDHCLIQGPLPDHNCTPGAVFTDATPEVICVSGYTKTVRNVSAKLKKEVYGEYGLDSHQELGTYEVDHLIPLELGGNNDIANLFPEAAIPIPGFQEKDLVENYLHQEVCSGRVLLDSAQKQIANDWVAVYLTLSSKQILELKGQFKSWVKN